MPLSKSKRGRVYRQSGWCTDRWRDAFPSHWRVPLSLRPLSLRIATRLFNFPLRPSRRRGRFRYRAALLLTMQLLIEIHRSSSAANFRKSAPGCCCCCCCYYFRLLISLSRLLSCRCSPFVLYIHIYTIAGNSNDSFKVSYTAVIRGPNPYIFARILRAYIYIYKLYI